MTTIRAKSKKAAPDICPKISNKISTREALSVVEATRQNVLEVFFLPSNRDKLSLIATEAISSSLTGFSSVKVLSKRHIWVSPSVASTPTKSPKVFNNRLVNKLVFPFIDSTLDAVSTTFSKKMVKKTKSSEKWEQLLVSAIVTPNSFVVPNEILDEISIALSGTSSKMDQDQLLAVLSNVVSSGRSLLVLEAKQFPPVELPVLRNWTDQIETDLSSFLVSETITSCQRFAGWVASTLVPGATFKIKLAHVKAVFQFVHGFLGAKSVSKDNVKLFCMEFAFQQSLEAVFLVELTSFIRLTTFKIAKSLVVSESGSFPVTVALCDIPLGILTADIKMALDVFGGVTCVVLKPAGVWQYVVSILVGKDSVRILLVINQNEAILSCNRFKAKLVNLSSGCTAFEIIGKRTCFIPWSPDSSCHSWFALITFDSQDNLDSAVETPGCWHCFRCQEIGHLTADCKVFLSPIPKVPKIFKSHFVSSALYAKTAASFGLSEFPSLVAPSAASAADPAVGSRLDSLKKQISDLAALVKSVGFLVALVSCFFYDNAVKTVQVKKNIISMKSTANNFANLMIRVSKDIACLRFKVDFGDMDYNGMLAAKPSFLSKDTIEHVIAL
ncbi:hypothetical protein G9A89_009444 [Geosiphon pyriformis]|nr:hypothetical protein G9A89_009444 [Geosiphon pyriformis]